MNVPRYSRLRDGNNQDNRIIAIIFDELEVVITLTDRSQYVNS